MKAKEMFEKLGYELEIEEDGSLYYSDDDIGICFNQFFKRIEINCFYGESTAYIEVSDIKAINKQIEELGWM